ncbi:MAG TPA: threonine/serine exporter family protein, partial [Nakamurella sp.]
MTVVQTVVPATPPAAVQSGIGRGTVLIALAVLLIALAVVVLAVRASRTRRRSGEAAPTRPSTVAVSPLSPPAPPVTADSVGSVGWSSPIDGSGLHELMAFMVDLGDTMVDSGDPVTHVGECLGRVARVNGAHGAEVIVLPTALIITLPGLGEGRTEVASTGGSRLRLDQVEAVFTVADRAERGDLGPRAALVALRSARDLPPSYGPGVIVAGH